ncbi:MAG: alpha/beta hydrolase fold domain-containing protein [Acidimicrobiales bacterium]
MTTETSAEAGTGIVPPGRLGDPNMALRDDPRADPRMVAALAAFGLDGPPEPVAVTAASPLAELRAWAAETEVGFEALFAGLGEGAPAVQGVVTETVRVPARDGGEIQLYIHRPAEAAGPLPCVYHIHGGGMVLIGAAGPCYQLWRSELAAAGLVVVGVEFRNAAGKLGPHPYPTGLHDCADGLRWVADHRAELGVSSIVLSGESGGANLCLSLTHLAKREGWLGAIAGVYAQCPYIAGREWSRPESPLASLVENDGYFISRDLFPVMTELYDPGDANGADPTCWPAEATMADLAGMPPHVVSVNELDPLRDEGLAYYRRLRDAGVSVVGRVVPGTCHGADVFFAVALPDVHAASLRDVSGFARSFG